MEINYLLLGFAIFEPVVVLAVLYRHNSLLRGRVNDLIEKVAALQKHITFLEASHMEIPLPVFFQDNNGRMLSVNTAYERFFLLPLKKTREDILGKNDKEFWGATLGGQMWSNSALVLTRVRTIEFEERVLGTHGSEVYKVLKWPVMTHQTVVGVAGVFIPNIPVTVQN